MQYTIQDIQSIIGAKGIVVENTIIENLVIDSRKIIFPNSSLFFALHSDRRDGHTFIEEAYQRGVRNFVVEKYFDFNKYLNLAKKFTSIVNKQKISDYKIDLKNNNLIIGFISGDFREHAVAYQITGLIRELKKYKDIKLFAYSNNDYEDNKTQELKSYFDKFENIFRKRR